MAYLNSGGTITTDGLYKVHKFTSTGTFVCGKDGNVSVLVVGGGGGGSGKAGGGAGETFGAGGGAGAFNIDAALAIVSGNRAVTVGVGGVRNTTDAAIATAGGSSGFEGVTSAGGGGGGISIGLLEPGGAGASGGGGAAISGSGGTASDGYDGGAGAASANYGSGGGGGAGAVGTNGTTTVPGAGGAGLSSAITGSTLWYAGGGGGILRTTTGTGAGGSGVGGDGGDTNTEPTAPTANTGSGGGGNCGTAGGGTAGADGVVIIRCLTSAFSSDPQLVTPGTLALALTLYAPTITASDHKIATPSTLALGLTFYAPTISTPRLVTPSTLALVLATYAPTVAVAGNIEVIPSTLSLAITTYAPTITTPLQYFIQVDWDNNDNFTGTYDDITSDVKLISFSRGKSDELGQAEVGQCSLTLNNADGEYTPGYGGVISALLLPKRPIRIRAALDGTTYNLFYGFIEEIIPHPHLSEQDCIITAVDGIDFLSRHDLSTTLYKDTGTGAIHTAILDDAGWSATMRTLDTGQDTVPYWYGQDVKARFAQEEIDDSEQGFSWVDGAGYFNFEDRYHRSTATHQTSQGTFDNTMAYITYSLNPKNIYNIVKVTVTPWDLKSEAELWRLQETPSIAVGNTQVWWGNTQYPVDAWVTPASTTDYTANSQADGGGDDMTSDIVITTTKFAKSIKLSIVNNGTVPAYITLLKARGTYYDDQTTVTRKAEDSTSQTAYQKRTLTIDGKYMTDAELAQDLCSYAIGKYKDPRAELSMSIMNQDEATLTQILAREISDRVTVVNTKLGVSADYFIDYMQHDITMGGKSHTATYRLADCINEDFWCLGFSKLGLGTKLAY